MKQSAGILLFNTDGGMLKVLLVHPGGPFFAKKDAGAWSIPKGEFEAGEEPLSTARREFEEETGQALQGEFIALQPVKQKSGKLVWAWAVKGDFDVSALKSNTFEMEWPPKSGRKKAFPEVDRAEWFDLEQATEKILPAQQPLLNELRKMVAT